MTADTKRKHDKLCTRVFSGFCASLIDQPWMQSPKHVPATRCTCGLTYFSWSAGKEFFAVRTGDTEQGE